MDRDRDDFCCEEFTLQKLTSALQKRTIGGTVPSDFSGHCREFCLRTHEGSIKL